MGSLETQEKLKQKERLGIKKVIEFLKETYNSLNGNPSKEEINNIIEKISNKINENIEIDKQIYISDMSDLFNPFCRIFYSSYGDPESIEIFELIIEERQIDEVIPEKPDLPDKL